MVSEYQRVCKVCGKKWHSLVSREAEIIQRRQANAAQGLAGCCSPNTSATSIGTGQLIDTELQRLRQCPECQSANYEEVITDHEDTSPTSAQSNSTIEQSSTSSDSSTETSVPKVEGEQPKSKLGCTSVLMIIGGITIVIMLISAVAGAISNASKNSASTNSYSPSSSGSSGSGSGSSPTKSPIPSGWNSDERSIWTLLEASYPVIGNFPTPAKALLMENAHLVCQAYGEGYGRVEILNATNSSEFPNGLIDDMMTLAVSEFCPQYMDQQLR